LEEDNINISMKIWILCFLRLVPEIDVNIFVDANHAHDKVTERSVRTRLFCFVGCTPPVMWKSKRQASVQTPTCGRRHHTALLPEINVD
jgi:hypothetical protein